MFKLKILQTSKNLAISPNDIVFSFRYITWSKAQVHALCSNQALPLDLLSSASVLKISCHIG